ncbi:hypothetical protein [Gloeocapsopsis dulcis]|uniref:DUF1232 domain-containing protein n=1 Tax=Gloeocapsopsis dulcis AAB1 = 1H9 TaxID=1433147 RepID=A0A6N8FYF3_9CHRO|nr:hypothetical protein [Gloeocapsopsis dulcis]MUL37794.1 hypothetical protein [Gloeocapsopsis dulcis AAB1 = 1H9]WNN90586.1 hypothetical protein P0S91_05745 [Gloeocapsopsis dulcis]
MLKLYFNCLEQFINQIKSFLPNKHLVQKVRSPFVLLRQLGLSSWMRICIYLFLDYIILPADLFHKILPDTQFTDIFSSLSTIFLSLAIYIVPELKEVTRQIQN